MRLNGLMKMTAVAAAILLCAVWANADGAKEALSFVPVDVYIETFSQKLGAYQLEIGYDPSTIYLVGVEGGDAPFAAPPYYDPEGLTGGRIVLASFTTDERLPAGRLWVARLHLAVSAGHEADLNPTLQAVANPQLDNFDARVFIVPFHPQREAEDE